MGRARQLEVQICKKLTDFTLDVAFRATEKPLSILGASGAGNAAAGHWMNCTKFSRKAALT